MFYENELYYEDLIKINEMNLPFEKLNNKTILITGSVGLIGSFIVDVLMYRNINLGSNITIIANSLNMESINRRFSLYINNRNFKTLIQNVIEPLKCDMKIDYVIHAASNAHPNAFKEDPTGTMLGNLIGVKNILEYLKEQKSGRFVYISSGEIYGLAEEGIEEFVEDYQGYVDILNPRSCYPVSKRASETLAICYSKQYDLDIVIARPCHTYGPNVTKEDSRVSAQFINSILNDENITMKSDGSQKRSYSYITDTVSALFYIMLKGENRNAYNIANPDSIVTISEMARIIANIGGKEVFFEIPKNDEKKNFNPMELAILSSNKLESLGWKPLYNAKNGFERCIKILKKENY